MMAGETVMAFSLDDEEVPAAKRPSIADELRRGEAEDLAIIEDEPKNPEPVETMGSQFGLVVENEPAAGMVGSQSLFLVPDSEPMSADVDADVVQPVVGFVGPAGAVGASEEPVIELPEVDATAIAEIAVVPENASADSSHEPHSVDAAKNVPLITASRSIAMLVPAAMLVEGLLGRE